MTWTSEAAKREAEQILDFEQQVHAVWEKKLGPDGKFPFWSCKLYAAIDKLKKKHWDAKGIGE